MEESDSLRPNGLNNQNFTETSLSGEVYSKKSSSKLKLLLIILLLIILTGLGLFYFLKFQIQPKKPVPPWGSSPTPSVFSEELAFQKFTSEEEFKNYLKDSQESEGELFGNPQMTAPGSSLNEIALDGTALKATGFGGIGGGAERVSETNVQVKGVDEPDMIKTDGKEIYFSPDVSIIRPLPLLERRDIYPPAEFQSRTKLIRAFPPADLAKDSEIEKTGNLLIEDNFLVVFSNQQKIYGYDISDPKLPIEKWNIEFEDNHYLVDARLLGGKIYLITSARVNYDHPCPISPITSRRGKLSVACIDIYHPSISASTDSTYTAVILDPKSGEIKDSLSFIGSSSSSIVYMSPQNLYLTYSFHQDMIDFIYRFLQEKAQDLFPNYLLEKLEKLRNYDLTSQTKMVEFGSLYQQYLDSISEDERMRIENEFNNRMKDYSQAHIRELERTGMIKIRLEDFEAMATGSFPGRPLNQFSLDEFDNHLRVATTVNGGNFGTSESANDVYVFNDKLSQVGSVLNLGLGERIYSARFIEEKGYLVTFRQTDPFYVLDLSNPQNPVVKGQLKIPGYSSYLHPISKSKILGIGKEGSEVKASLFDVSSPDNPTEISKYVLSEYWSDILNTHHAFLLDSKHEVFFLPGSKGGYVFSYRNNTLSLVKTVAEFQVKRAVYLNDYLYIVGENKITVLNENDWEQVNQLDL